MVRHILVVAGKVVGALALAVLFVLFIFCVAPLIVADQIKREDGTLWACQHHKNGSVDCSTILPTFLDFWYKAPDYTTDYEATTAFEITIPAFDGNFNGKVDQVCVMVPKGKGWVEMQTADGEVLSAWPVSSSKTLQCGSAVGLKPGVHYFLAAKTSDDMKGKTK